MLRLFNSSAAGTFGSSKAHETKTYGDIEPVGWKYGVFIPLQQPLEDFFIVIKEGDYDGRLLLIAKNGA